MSVLVQKEALSIYGSPGSSYKLEIDFHLVCLLYMISSLCKDIGHYHFFPEGNLTLIWEQRKTVLSFEIPAIP